MQEKGRVKIRVGVDLAEELFLGLVVPFAGLRIFPLQGLLVLPARSELLVLVRVLLLEAVKVGLND